MRKAKIKKEKMAYITEDGVPKGDAVPACFIIPSNLTWGGDYTISIFLRDWLLKFKELNNGVPNCYVKEANGDIDKAAELYNNDITDLANKFDYIVKHCDDWVEENIDLDDHIHSTFAKLADMFQGLWW